MANPTSEGMSQQRWERTHDYIEQLFSDDPENWSREDDAAVAAGLPAISVGAAVGRWLSLLAAMSREGGAQLIVEVGTHEELMAQQGFFYKLVKTQQESSAMTAETPCGSRSTRQVGIEQKKEEESD